MATDQLNGVIHHLRRAAFLQASDDLTDGRLLEGFIAHRDATAFELLVKRHGPMVLGVCRRLLNNPHDAEDAFQATFLVLVRKATSIRPREMVGNWLHGVAYRTACEARAATVRRRAREKQVNAIPEPEAATADDRWQEMRPVLDQELNRLPDKYRIPIVLCDLEGKSHKDAAQQLGWPQGTLSGRLSRARVMLAKRLTRRGLVFSAGALAVALSENAASACVPASLMVSTVKSATMLAAGQTAAAVASAQVAALTEGVLKAMLMTKLKMTAFVMLIVGAALMGSGALVRHSFADSGADRSAIVQPEPLPAEERLASADEEALGLEEQPKEGPTVGGTLQSLDAANITITVTNRQTGKSDKTFALAKDVAVLRDGKVAKVGDLKKGGRITLKLSEDQKTAVSISEMGKTMSGPFKSVDPANNTITLTVTGGRDPVKKDVTHQLAKDGKVTLQGKDVKLADLKDVKPGSTIQLTFSVDDEKKLIHIQHTTRNRPGNE